MRWILVILFLYIIPLGMLFKNKADFKRASMYGSIYTVVASVIIISNIYISTVNKMENIIDQRNYAMDEKHAKDTMEVKLKEKEDILNEDISYEKDEEIEKEANNMNFQEDYGVSEIENVVDDKTMIKEFKEDIYEVERKALIPMRECMPDLKNINITPKAIKEAKEDIDYAKKMCEEVVDIYEEMDIPNISNVEYTKTLEKAKVDVKQAYILRGKAMESSEKLLSTKNLKYVGEIKEYLRLSDVKIKSFVESIKSIQQNLE